MIQKENVSRRILLVEDNEKILRANRQMLEWEGYTIDTAMSLTQAWSLMSMTLLFSLCACTNEKTAKTITVDNETGYVISDLRMSAVHSGEWGPNRLEQTLSDTKNTVIELGNYTKDELIEGYSIQLFDEYDTSFGAVDNVLVEPGDTLTLFMSDGALAWSLDGSLTVDKALQPEVLETRAYHDQDTDVRMTYPSTMAARLVDDAIFVEGSGCGVTVRDVEATYDNYSGYDSAFLSTMQTNCLMQDFNEIYGDGTDVSFSSIEQDDWFTWSMAEFHVDIYNNSTHADAFGMLL